jgi:superfamily II DNA/RNA helicase
VDFPNRNLAVQTYDVSKSVTSYSTVAGRIARKSILTIYGALNSEYDLSIKTGI